MSLPEFCSFVASVLYGHRVEATTLLDELAVGSLEVVELMVALGEAGVRLPPEDLNFDMCETVADLYVALLSGAAPV